MTNGLRVRVRVPQSWVQCPGSASGLRHVCQVIAPDFKRQCKCLMVATLKPAMYNDQDWAADHVRDIIQERLEKTPAATTSFSFDDAFSDADDGQANYAFSSVVIRADLARAVSNF